MSTKWIMIMTKADYSLLNPWYNGESLEKIKEWAAFFVFFWGGILARRRLDIAESLRSAQKLCSK